MKWIFTFLNSSIGKKQVVAITGLLLFGFLLTHLAGNLLLLVDDGTSFNKYAKSLMDLGPLLYVLEVGLALVFLVHIFFALSVTRENIQARPQKYVVKNWAGMRSIGSRSMPITGIAVLIFLVVHIVNFRVAKDLEANAGKPLYNLVVELFQNPAYVAYYVFSIVLLGIHLSHGLQSVARTLGLSNQKYLSLCEKLSILLASLVTIGYIIIPIYLFCIKGGGLS